MSLAGARLRLNHSGIARWRLQARRRRGPRLVHRGSGKRGQATDFLQSPACASGLLGFRSTQQRSDTPDRDPPVLPRVALRVHLEVLLAVALGRQILGRHLEALRENRSDGFGAAV